MPRYGRAAAWTAAALAVASAAASGWWLAGGTTLLDTVGGAMESLARDRSTTAFLLGAAVVVAKLLAAGLALGLLRRPSRAVRVLALLGGCLLSLWGAANVVAGGAVLTGVLELGPVADPRALRWHVLFWDAWFLVWGLALLAAAWSSRGTHRSSRGADRSAGAAGRITRPDQSA